MEEAEEDWAKIDKGYYWVEVDMYEKW